MHPLRYSLVVLFLFLGMASQAQVIPVEQPVTSTTTPAKTTKVKKKASHKTVVDTVKVYEPVAAKPAEPAVADNKFNFLDGFTDNSNGWPTVSDANKEISVSDGKLIIKNNTNGRAFHCGRNFAIEVKKDFLLKVTAKWVSGTTGSGFGVYFCSNDQTGSFYTFEISSNGNYTIGYFENRGNVTLLKAWTNSPYINQGMMPNILTVKREGSYIRFIINDHLVENFPFEGAYGDGFGFRVSDAQNVKFENFTLTGTAR